MADAFIKLHRKMLEWEWYKDTNTFVVFIHCLLIANWKEGRFMGHVIPRGSFVSSYAQLAQQTNLSVQNVRTAISHLKSTGELTSKSHPKFTVFTVVNYNRYQDTNKQTNSQLTDDQQATNKQLTTIEEYKEEEERKNKNNNTFVKPNVDEVRAYCLERGNSVDAEAFINFYESKGWLIGKNKMKDWKAAVRTWERSRQNPKPEVNKKIHNYNEREVDYAELERLAIGN